MRHTSIACAALSSAVLWSWLSVSAIGQQTLWTLDGTSTNDSMGRVVASVGDANGDGVDDLVAHAPGFDIQPHGPAGVGQAVLLSGATGQILHSWKGKFRYEGTAVNVGAVGDVDGDGFVDVGVGAPYAIDSPTGATYVGVVRLYSGATGALIHEIQGDASVDRFGASFDFAGDVNLDGLPDLVVGAMNATDPSTGQVTGKAELFAGGGWNALHTFYGTGAADQFGVPVRSIDDVDNDGIGDLLIGARQSDNLGPYHTGAPGYAKVYSGATGQLLRTHTGRQIGDGFGSALDGIGDITGDGIADYAVGAPLDKQVEPAGTASIFSGANGSLLRRLQGDLVNEFGFGGQISGIGDFNGDGVPDFSIGNQWQRVDEDLITGTQVFSGATSRLLTTLFASGFPAYAKVCAGPSDLDGDGFTDVVIGDNVASPGGQNGAGRVWARGGNDLFLSALPFDVDSGDVVDLTVRGGPAFAPMAVALIDVAGVPAFQIVITDSLDSNGEWSLQVPYSGHLGGTPISLRAYALSGLSAIDSSDQVLLLQ